MEIAARVPRRSRIESRFRRTAEDATDHASPVQLRDDYDHDHDHGHDEKKEEEPFGDLDESLLAREQQGRAVMGRAHRMFHRRAEVDKVLTVVVDVVATVDSNGNLLGLATSTPVVDAQAVPTLLLPSVPQVPPFPSDLTVPAYPWPSGVPNPAAITTSSPLPSSLPGSAQKSGASSVVSSEFPIALTTLNSTSSIQSSSQSSSQSPSRTVSQDVATLLTGTIGFEPVTNTGVPAATSAAAISNANSKPATPLETPKVVASVIGSLAGAALFLVVILFLIRRHKRRISGGGAHRLPDTADNERVSRSGPQMATRTNSIPASTAAFFNRFSGASRSTTDTSTTAGGGGEKGFQRISGRKLPSAFSEGMTSDQFAREGTLSGSSFYQDDKGFYGGPGAAGAKGIGEASAVGAAMTKDRVVPMPSPARTPTVHHAPPPFGESRNGGSLLSPPHSPNPSLPPRGTLGRSHPSQDGSRNSRFTEDV